MPARKFLNPSGNSTRAYLTQPPRPCPEVADEPEVVARIAAASRIRDEPEAPSDNWVDAEADLRRTYARQQYLLEVAHAQQLRACLTMEQRMAEAKRRAKMRHFDVSSELRLIRHLHERALGGGRNPAAAVGRMEKLEAKLDYRPDLAA